MNHTKNEYSDLKLLNLKQSSKIYSIEEIKNIARQIFSKYNFEKVYLFGSYARGEATKLSDIDIMVVGGNINTLMNLSDFALELVKIFKKEIDIVKEENYTKKDDNEYFDLANKLFYNVVRKERVLIYG